ncbi:MAG TPA: hypothetical protein VHF89_20700 [Solirubrobacteraceae bacterium]|nr:hypothetical protein [Solirubrobacteraceae bacterium]
MDVRLYEGVVDLPYVVEEVEGARHLLVVFPRSVPNAPPHVELRRHVGHFNAHRVYLGADEHLYMGPNRERRGARAAAELIRQVAEQLEVDGPQVIAFGTSWRAVCAMYIGLLAGAGRIVVGGPPVHFGWHVHRLAKLMPPDPEAGARRRLLSGILELDRRGVCAFWDGLILDTAREATHEARIDMFVSPDDNTWPDAFWLAEKLVDHPTLSVSLTTLQYGEHAGVTDAFYSFLDRKLIGDVGRVPEPSPERT